MARIKDIKEKQFSRLKVIQFSYINKKGSAVWECLCDCGKITYVSSWNLTSGNTKSCGCYNKEMHSDLIKKNKLWDINRHYWIPELVDEMTIKIPLDNGEFSLVDKEDLHKIKDIFWIINKKGYIIGKSNNHYILLHRLVTGFKKGVVHHINKDKKDNRKVNLEVLTKHIHDRYPKGIKDTTGITKRKDTGKYLVRKYLNGIRVYIGQTNTIEEALILLKNKLG